MSEATSRRTEPPIKVYCLPHERELILHNARSSGNSASRYLLLVGQGYEVTSILYYQYVEELAKVNADLARLGNLLKLTITQHDRLAAYGQLQTQGAIQQVLLAIQDNQQTMRATMAALVTPIAAKRVQR